MHLDDLDWLVTLVRERSLGRTARAKSVAVSTAARRLDAIEAELGLRLFDRGRTGASPTRAGNAIMPLVRDMAVQADRLARTAAAIRNSLSAPVVVSATEFIIAEVLAPCLGNMRRQADGIVVTLHSQGDVISLAGREADLAVRMVRPVGADLMIKKLMPLQLGLFASAEFLNGRSPDRLDLRGERLVLYDDSFGRLPENDWVDQAGLAGSVVARTGSTRALLNAALSGSAIALLPVAIGLRHRLLEVSAPAGLPARTPWLVCHRDLRRIPEIRIVHRWIQESFERWYRESMMPGAEIPS